MLKLNYEIGIRILVNPKYMTRLDSTENLIMSNGKICFIY